MKFFSSLLAFSILFFALFAQQGMAADLMEEWLQHKIPSWEPKITYTGKPFHLKWSHPAPPSSMVPPLWNKANKWFSEATGGKVTFKEYGAGTLHGAKGGFKAVRSGISNYATCYSGFEGRGFEMLKLFTVPFVASPNSLITTRIYQELGPKYFNQEFEKRGVLYGHSSPLPPADIMTKKPILKLEDLKGMKIIAQGFPPDAAKALGFVSLNIPFPEIYTSLQQGVAEGVIWTDFGFVPYRIFEIAKYRTTVGGLFGGAIDTCYNRKTFKSFPPDIKKAFHEFQQKMGIYVSRAAGPDYARYAGTVYDANGVTRIRLPLSETERWKAAVQPVLDARIAALEKQGKPGQQLYDDIKMLKEKYADYTNDQLIRLVFEQPIPGNY